MIPYIYDNHAYFLIDFIQSSDNQAYFFECFCT